MTVLRDDGKADPGTHVLLIGVGSYPFLEGGTPGQTFVHSMGMGQLSSPPVSVRVLADWFTNPRNGFNNPDRPLRSLAVLCSDVAPFLLEDSTGAEVAVERARMPAVTQAVLAWMGRAGRNTENLAVFFFCGHGVAFGEAETALLLEDFGGNTTDPMDEAIAFEQMRMGVMRQCDATYQCHLIDACRTPVTRAFGDAFDTRKSIGKAIASSGISRALRDKVAPAFLATDIGASAYGLTGQASLFTQALLGAMRGPACREKDDYWEIQAPALAEGINKYIATLNYQTQLQYCQPIANGRELALHRLRAEPEVVVKVFTRDPANLKKSVLVCLREPDFRMEKTKLSAPWSIALTRGKYRFEARLATDTSQLLGERETDVVPPGKEFGL